MPEARVAIWMRMAVISPARTSQTYPALDEPGTQSCKFGVADRPCLFKPFELFNFICGAETNRAPELITRLLSLLHIALCHASTLKDQISKDGKVWKDDQCYYPDGLDPTRNVVATEQN
jgi:hypothetical protein